MYTPKGSKAKSDAIQVARAICSGDISAARSLVLAYRRSARTVAEGRAIVGACRFASEAYDADLDPRDFLWPANTKTPVPTAASSRLATPARPRRRVQSWGTVNGITGPLYVDGWGVLRVGG